MRDRKKKVDNISKNDISNENIDFEKIVKDASELHDKLLKIGFKEIAEDVLKIHDRLLMIEEEKTRPDISKQFSKNEKEGGGDTSTLTSLFLRDKEGHIYGKIGVNSEISTKELLINEPTRSKSSKESLQKDTESYSLFLQDIRKSIGLWLDENLAPTFIDGAVNEITGYNKEDFRSMNLKWIDLVIPEDQPLVLEHIEWVKSNPNIYAEIEYRILMKDGRTRWLREIIHVVPENQRYQGAFQSFVYDIDEEKKADEKRMKFEEVQKREIHHRIKNNLQVISSLLDLQAENLTGSNVCDTSRVLEAFKDSQNRITSMALIHEELYRSTNSTAKVLDFSAYLKKLIAYLFETYSRKSDNISLILNLEQVNLDMDIAIPLGIIVNELVSNSFKHAFPAGGKWEINLNLKKTEEVNLNKQDSETVSDCEQEANFQYILTVADNGRGIPEEIDLQNVDSLGLQLVNILVEQIDGCIELRRQQGTEFTIWFKDVGLY